MAPTLPTGPQVPSTKSSSEQIRPERLPRRLFHSQRRNTVLLQKEEIAAWWGWTTDIILDGDRFERKAQLLSETTGGLRECIPTFPYRISITIMKIVRIGADHHFDGDDDSSLSA